MQSLYMEAQRGFYIMRQECRSCPGPYTVPNILRMTQWGNTLRKGSSMLLTDVSE